MDLLLLLMWGWGWGGFVFNLFYSAIGEPGYLPLYRPLLSMQMMKASNATGDGRVYPVSSFVCNKTKKEEAKLK